MSVPGLLQLCAHTRAPRHEVIPATNDVLNACGVILEDLHEYSNRMMTYRFEIARAELAGLYRGLVEAALAFDDEEPLAAADALKTDADGFLRATLQLSFPAEDGERRNPNPDMG